MIINKLTREVVSKKELYCNSFLSQSRGLMFRSKQNIVMRFPYEKTLSLHMWFVFFPIDVLVLDESMMVVQIRRDFRPWTFWSSTKKGKYFVELGEGSNQVRIGDVLEFR